MDQDPSGIEPARVDQLLAAHCDDALSDEGLTVLDAAERQRAIELALVDVLVDRVYHPEQALAAATRVERGMALLWASPATTRPTPASQAAEDEPATVPLRGAGRRWWLSGFTAAAAALLIAFLVRTSSPHAIARAAVQTTAASARDTVDRQYEVTIDMVGPLGRPRHSQAELYVRGEEAFALRHPGAAGGELWIGSDGPSVWFIPAISAAPALVSSDRAKVAQFLNEGQVVLAQPFVQVASVLNHLADDARYEVELLPEEPLPANAALPAAPDQLWQRVRGSLRASGGLWPPRVELWTDAEGVARRLELHWPDQGAPGLRQVVFDLVSALPQAPRFYHYSAHTRRPAIDIAR